jgi:hypothetical protein
LKPWMCAVTAKVKMPPKVIMTKLGPIFTIDSPGRRPLAPNRLPDTSGNETILPQPGPLEMWDN